MKKRLLALALCAALLAVFQVPATVAADDGPAMEYTVDQPYEYPVNPDSQQWQTLMRDGGWAAVVEACHVDEEVLLSMTTPALLETVMDYPALFTPLAFNSDEHWLKNVSSWGFKGIDILLTREDAPECMKEYLARQETARNGNQGKRSVALCLAGRLGLEVNSEEGERETAPAAQPQGVVSTPAGTPVDTLYNAGWDYWGSSYEAALEEQEYWLGKFAGCTVVSNPNPSYNCHSYAWYSTSTSNKQWISDPTPYMVDGSYDKQTSAGVGYKVHWTEGDHSGIVRTMAGGPNNPTVISKWGRLGVIIHPLKSCPYSGAVTYWKR